MYSSFSVDVFVLNFLNTIHLKQKEISTGIS